MTSDHAVEILVVNAASGLHEEVASAAEAMRRLQAAVVPAGDQREALDAVRDRRPALVCVEIEDVAAVEAFAEEVDVLSPETAVVALYPLAARYQDDLFGPGVSERDVILRVLRSHVRDVIQRPVAPEDLEQALERVLDSPRAQRASLGRVVSFVSNKGGVGKSTLSVNIAAAVAAEHPDRVLLIDASLQHGTCASMLDVEPESTVVDAVRERERLDPTLLQNLAAVHPCGLHLLAAPVDAVEAQEVDDAALTRVVNVARRAYDLVLVDTFPILDAVVLGVIDLSDTVYVVVPPSVPTVQGMVRHLDVLEGLGLPPTRRRIVLNHPHPRFASELSAADVARRLGRPVDHEVPYHQKVLVGLNTGEPYALRARRWWGFGKALRRLTAELEEAFTARPPAAATDARRRDELRRTFRSPGDGARGLASGTGPVNGGGRRDDGAADVLLVEEHERDPEGGPAGLPAGGGAGG